jgi:protein disulfide-isomerase-like protein
MFDFKSWFNGLAGKIDKSMLPWYILIAFLSLLFLSYVNSSRHTVQDGGNANANDNANANQNIAGPNTKMLLFYAPWCGACKGMMPIWDDLSNKYGDRVKFSKIDCDIEKQLADQYDVQRFPTIFIEKNGTKTQYQGPRDYTTMEKLINSL